MGWICFLFPLKYNNTLFKDFHPNVFCTLYVLSLQKKGTSFQKMIYSKLLNLTVLVETKQERFAVTSGDSLQTFSKKY